VKRHARGTGLGSERAPVLAGALAVLARGPVVLAGALAVLTGGLAVPSAAAGTRTAAFAPVDPGVRAAAMGGAFSALGGQPSAMYWNPAALFFQQGRSLEASYSSLYGIGLAKRSQLTLGMKHTIDEPQFRGTRVVVRRDETTGPAYGLGLQSLFVDLEEDGYSELAVGAAAAWGYGYRVAAGLSVRGLFVSSDLDQVSANGYDIGFGVAFRLSERERIGLAAPHLISRVFWDFDSTERLPFGVQAGWARMWGNGVTSTAEVELREGEDDPYRLAAGAEWWVFPERLALRGGYRRLAGGIEDVSQPTFGAGVRFSRLLLDYAFRLESEQLGDTHRVGLLLDF